MIGAMFIDLAIAVGILVGAIIALNKSFGKTRKVRDAIEPIIDLINALAGLAIGVLIAIEAFTLLSSLINNVTTKSKKAVDSFGIFLKLAGVGIIIVSIAAAIFILVKALKEMASINSKKLNEFYGMLLGLVVVVGLLAVGIATAASKIEGAGKLKKISLSLTGAILSIAAIMGVITLLIDQLNHDWNGGWWKSLLIFTAIVDGFTIMSATLLLVGKEVSAKSKIWDKLSKYIMILASCVAILAGSMWLLGNTKPIDGSVIATIGILTVAFLGIISLLALIAVAVSKTKGDFAKKFVPAIAAITISIASIVSAFGLLMAGIGVLIASISSIDNNKLNVNKASDSLIKKFEMAAAVLENSVPALKTIFFNVGKSVGSIFGSFMLGFAEGIAEIGYGLNAIAERVTNVIIDLLGKVINILYNRKDEIAEMVINLMHFIADLIATVLNTFFGTENSIFKIDGDQVLKLLGITGIIIGVSTAISKFKFLGTALASVKTYFESLIATGSVGIGGLVSAALAFAAAFGEIYVGITAISGGIKQLSGEAKYIRSDVTDFGSAIEAFFTDAQFRTQTFIDAIMLIGETIAKVVETVIRVIISAVSMIAESVLWPIQMIMYLWAEFFEMIGKKDWADNVRNVTSTVMDTIHKGTQAANNDTIGELWSNWTTFNTNNVVDGAYQNGKKIGKGLSDGTVDGYNDKAVLDALEKYCKEQKGEVEHAWLEHSPSKVMEEIYKNVMLGEKLGVEKGKNAVNNALKQVAKEQKKITVNGAIDAVKAWDAVLESTNINPVEGHEDEINRINSIRGTDQLRNTNVKTYDYTKGKGQDPSTIAEVELNQKLLDLFIAQKEVFEGKTFYEARSTLEGLAQESGIVVSNYTDFGNIISAAMSTISGATTVTSEAIQNLDNNTRLSLMDVVDKEKAATQMVIEDQYGRYFDMWDLAEDNKEFLVGKKREEVEEILKQAAIEKGMTEQEAKDSAKLVTAAMFAGTKANAKISESELNRKLKGYDQDYKAFEETEKAKTDLLQKQATARALLEKNAEYQKLVALHENKEISDQEFSKRLSENQYISSLTRTISSLGVQYQNVLKKQEEDIKKLYTNAGMSATNINKYWDQQLKDARTVLTKQQKGTVKDKIQGLISQFKNYLGLGAGGLDLDPWNTKDTTTKTTKTDKDAVKAAKDLKTDLEKERADLTPTFDLDKLASDANKANGIVMSSLMAAQNASIGDYINQDSELNPFMKDRWQNVYNFTQNNYSPKALSRIDIYRQTQRQISMSRGF